jgi:cytidylate kinase
VNGLEGRELRGEEVPPSESILKEEQKGGIKMSVITVSRQLGSQGVEIAKAIASRFNYQYVDKEKIGIALADRGLPRMEIEKLDEKKPPFWDSWAIDRNKFFHHLQMIIYGFAQKNNAVIVGRGGQILLKDLPGVLQVRVIAPFEVRIRRVMEQQRVKEKQAIRLLRRSDEDSAGFIRSFFNADWEDPRLYDLVINTQKLSVDSAVMMILEAIQAPEIKKGEKKTERKLADLILFQRVESTLMALLGVGLAYIYINVEEGVVLLDGTVNSGTDLANCERAVASIEGVERVNNHLSVSRLNPSVA